MVWNGPEPPEDLLEKIIPPSNSDIPIAALAMESDDDDDGDYSGYQPLPQGPDGYISADHDDEQENENIESANETTAPPSNIPPIEPADVEITRQVWSSPRPIDPIQMDSERAQQVMSAMANFSLPVSSIPDWAQSVSEDQWKQRLHDKIEFLRAKP